MRSLIWAFLLCGRVGIAQAPAATTAIAQRATPNVDSSFPGDDGVRLAPGDILRVTVWRRPELSGDSVVGDDGTLNHPLYRTVRVTDVPMSVVEARVRTFLQRFNDDPQFTIEPMVRVALSGEVRNANVYTLAPRTSIAQAIEIAGGVTDRGRRNDIKLLRSNRSHPIDLTHQDAIAALGPVRSGDQIFVPRHHDFFREYLAPTAAVTAAVAAVINASQRRRR